MPRKSTFFSALYIGIILVLIAGYLIYRGWEPIIRRNIRTLQWIRNPAAHPEWSMKALMRCGDAPFLFPTDGYIGYLWDDSFRLGHRHQGIDIFGGTDPGLTAVYSVFDGYLTRLSDWKSTVVIRIPSDPFQPDRQIWVYYTHLADPEGKSLVDPEFPPGSSEDFVKSGTRLGYQGNYSGTPGNPVGVHLHFSIIKDDGSGHFLNELRIENTLDPSPYLGISLNAKDSNEGPITCP
jgi:hypothetical protein